MRLEEYWGIGPKTKSLLADGIGVEAAVQAIESGDVRTLVDAGLPRGRATRILRHAHGGAAMDVLASPDSRTVYKELLALVSDYAVTEDAADRLRILTPLTSREAMDERLANVQAARESWSSLSEGEQETLLAVFSTYDDAGGGKQAAVETALALKREEFDSGVFEPLSGLDEGELADTVSALAGLQGAGRTGASGAGASVASGADERLDILRTQVGAIDDLAATPGDVLEAVQSGARGTDELRDALARHIADETGVDIRHVREALPSDSADAREFVSGTLRSLADDRRERVREREAEVADELSGVLEESRETIDATIAAVDDISLTLSLARFAIAFDLTRPTFVEEGVTGVVDARNLFLAEAGETVQPVTYAVGDHDLPDPGANPPPSGDRVAVLTGANSGGKTTLLETLCQVQLLAQMGLPVPATAAQIGLVDAIVFHRRHASFNAGVLESTLRSVVPPVTDTGQTLMLVDEFEAITEPGSAADLLHGLVQLTVDQDARGVFVTHLADDLEPLPENARTDGIFAEGLTTDLELEVDYQPRWNTVGRSTPEFIVSRLIADATDRAERAGYETLAQAVGESAVQRTLQDARWSE
jgi:DNA mismatch repair protein MutS2